MGNRWPRKKMKNSLIDTFTAHSLNNNWKLWTSKIYGKNQQIKWEKSKYLWCVILTQKLKNITWTKSLHKVCKKSTKSLYNKCGKLKKKIKKIN